MKKLIFVFFLALFSFIVSANENKDTLYEKKGNLFSIEPMVFYPYYFAISNPEIYKEKNTYKNQFNYGGGILISNYIWKLKTSAGFYLSSKKYQRESGKTAFVDKINFWNIPFIFSLKTKSKFSPYIGLIFNKAYSYNNINNKDLIIEICDSLGVSCFSQSPSGTSMGYNPPERWYLLNETFRIGVSYTFKELKHYSLSINFSCDYKLNNDIVIGGSDYSLVGSKSMLEGGKFSLLLGLNFEIFNSGRKFKSQKLL